MIRIWATLASSAIERPFQVGDLLCVELPSNCSVDGSVSEMREMLLDLVQFVRGPFLNIEQEARLREIEVWLAL